MVYSIHKTLGCRSFSAAGARQWNCLPSDVRACDLRDVGFKRLLITFPCVCIATLLAACMIVTEI